MSSLSQQLIVIGGKGGVGKSVTAAALARACQRRGQRTLLLGVDTGESLAALFDTPRDASLDELTELDRGLSMQVLRPKAVARDFLDIHFPWRGLNDRLTSSRAFHYWFDATPMLGELLMLGKIWHLIAEPEGQPWDRVIVEAPATGHSIGFLGSADEAHKMLVGPMKSRAAQVTELIRDPRRCRFVIVTLAEDMPANEAIELAAQAEQRVGIALGPLVVNALVPKLFQPDDPAPGAQPEDPFEAALDAAQRELTVRRARSEDILARLEASFPAPRIELPLLVAERFGLAQVDELSKLFEPALFEASS